MTRSGRCHSSWPRLGPACGRMGMWIACWELMPVFIRARRPPHLQAKSQPDVVEADFGEQRLKSKASFG